MIKSQKDFFSGLMFMLVGGAFAWGATGYTVGNDYGLHDFRDTDAGSMLRVKGADTLCPIGPGLITDWDFRGKQIRTLVNGELRQDGSTDEMAWDMHYLVADIARLITLVPGDVILSGTPAISRPVEIFGLAAARSAITLLARSTSRRTSR